MQPSGVVVVKVSLGAIAQVCDTGEGTVEFILNSIVKSVVIFID